MAHALRSMRGYSWGLNSHIMKMLITRVVNKIIMYGTAIWPMPMTARKVRNFNSIQRPFLINITRAFKITSTNALQVLAGLTPLPLQAEIEALYTKILQLKKSASYDDIIFNPQDYEDTPRKYIRHPSNFLQNLHCNLNNPPLSTKFTAYTDGSKIEDKVDCGVNINSETSNYTEWQSVLRHENSVFQAELRSIVNSIKLLLPTHTDIINVSTDSQSSICAVKQQFPNSPTVYLIQDLIFNSNNKFIISSTRGHSACAGSERADLLAKDAAIHQIGTLISIPWPKTVLNCKLKQLANAQWQHQWDHGQQGRRTYEFLPKVDENITFTSYFLSQ
ncbi:uncharacterized protein LOC118205141 [Stegodyphus dumicola]|uniref:uncharacterized protein LOC118205141 n=1 Tax=Stegodyphus dumicola TaxID=202533 RepID=UPI0015AA0979|nr:uncharacterized protein LOC118205141 [Stegodyphus dumicola]